MKKSKYLFIESIILGSSILLFILDLLLINILTKNTAAIIINTIMAFLFLFLASAVCFFIEFNVGIHQCPHCGHSHKPSFKEYLIAPHMGWTKWFKCSECGKKGWQKKILTEED